MEGLELYKADQLVARFWVEERPVEVGRELGCDIVVDDPDLAPRHWLIVRKRGTLVAYDVSRGKRMRPREVPIPLGRPWPLAGAYHVLRRDDSRSRMVLRDRPTVALSALPEEPGGLELLLAPGGDRKRHRLEGHPVHVGRDKENDVVLLDPRVSGRHCRLEPHHQGLLLRDLGSRNGTYVQGVRVERALVTVGTRLRVGETDIRVVATPGAPAHGRLGLLARSSEMLAVLDELGRIAPLSWPVLIHGESGTGKEGMAAALHRLSGHESGPYVTLNAGGVARELVESELFGHERGAFTGAAGTHRGVFEQADGGTLFLDEIGELALPLQARLLRVLEDGELRRVGAEQVLRVRVRLVCATHRDLRQMVAAGTFREDLYYRVARLVLEAPALRARPADIAVLSQHFLEEIAADIGPRVLSEEALGRLEVHRWPGNARELRNVLCTAAASTSARVLDAGDIASAMVRVAGGGAPVPDLDDLRRAVAHHGGNLSAAARALGIPRTTLRDRLRAA